MKKIKHNFIKNKVFEDSFSTIMKAVNKAIGELYGKKGVNRRKLKKFNLENEAINWGDLSCHRVEKCCGDKFIVFIEEASPDCSKFHNYIEEYMKKKHNINVRVITEW